jgi:uroporphyrinogen-III synthase
MREVPLSSNLEALKFADALFEGKFDVVVFLTGVGARALSTVVEGAHPTEKFLGALRKVAVFARGPKPVAVLREWGVPIALTAPEPNTWRELLRAIDDSKQNLSGKQVAVQEYGVSNTELLRGLRERGAEVTAVPVYQWDLPEDTGPLQEAVEEVVAGRIDVALFTTSVQIHHLFQIAEQGGKKDALKAGMERVVKASIGPTTSEVLRGYGLMVELEASHPKMGFLVKEAAENARALVQGIEARPR